MKTSLTSSAFPELHAGIQKQGYMEVPVQKELKRGILRRIQYKFMHSNDTLSTSSSSTLTTTSSSSSSYCDTLKPGEETDSTIELFDSFSTNSSSSDNDDDDNDLHVPLGLRDYKSFPLSLSYSSTEDDDDYIPIKCIQRRPIATRSILKKGMIQTKHQRNSLASSSSQSISSNRTVETTLSSLTPNKKIVRFKDRMEDLVEEENHILSHARALLITARSTQQTFTNQEPQEEETQANITICHDHVSTLLMTAGNTQQNTPDIMSEDEKDNVSDTNSNSSLSWDENEFQQHDHVSALLTTARNTQQDIPNILLVEENDADDHQSNNALKFIKKEIISSSLSSSSSSRRVLAIPNNHCRYHDNSNSTRDHNKIHYQFQKTNRRHQPRKLNSSTNSSTEFVVKQKYLDYIISTSKHCHNELNQHNPTPVRPKPKPPHSESFIRAGHRISELSEGDKNMRLLF